MKSLLYNSFVVMLFICLSVKYASSIQCYECESDDADSECGKRLNPSMIRYCPAAQKWCSSTQFSRDGVFYIKRVCVNPGDDDDDDTDMNDPKYKGMGIFMCNEDLCNGALDNKLGGDGRNGAIGTNWGGYGHNGAVDNLSTEIILFCAMLFASFYQFVY